MTDNFITNVNDLNDYCWEDECQHYEEEYGVDTEVVEPTEDHIFTKIVAIEKFLTREIKVYGKKTNVFNLLKTLSDDSLFGLLEAVAEDLAQAGKL